MIDCRIVGINQGMDFETNVSQTFLVLELPSGDRVQAAVDDETAAKVVTLQVSSRGVPQTTTRTPVSPLTAAPRAAAYTPSDELEEISTPDGPALVFGGQDDSPAVDDYSTPPEAAIDAEEDEEDEEDDDDDDEPPPPKQETPRQTKKRLRRNGSVPSRSVPKNEYGYPIVSGPDPEALTTQQNQDEDGVGSI